MAVVATSRSLRPGSGKSDVMGPPPRLAPNIAVFLVGLAISAALFAIVLRDAQEKELQRAYQEEAVPLTVALGRSIEHSLKAIASISGLYAASNKVERDDFRAFFEHTFGHDGEVQAVEWIPRVATGERAAYEAAARRAGFVDFQFSQRNAAGERVPAAARSEYFPVFFVEPLEGNEESVGFDLGSDPVRLEALYRARDTGETATTQRIRLVTETGEQFGFLAFVPIYSTGFVPETVAERREKLAGFALGVINIGDIVQSAVAQTPTSSKLDAYVLDAAAPPGTALLYKHGSSGRDHGALSEDELLLGGYEKTTLSVADRNWLLVFVPPPGFRFPETGAPWIVGTLGMLATVLFIGFQRATQNRTRLVEQTVFERTAELSAVTSTCNGELLSPSKRAKHRNSTQNANEESEIT